MQRIHIHVGVEDLEKSIGFYAALFGTEPVKTKADYAKWMLDDPAINFAISTRAGIAGIDHLGIQVSSDDELAQIRQRLESADMTLFDEGEAACCYARSEKSWVKDPSGIGWEAFNTMQDLQMFSEDAPATDAACDVPDEKKPATAGSCC